MPKLRAAIISIPAIALTSALLLQGCAPLLKPVGADIARNQLMALKADPSLAPQVPTALLDAELAVQAAELPTRDLAAGQHAVVVAETKIDIARAEAERRNAEDALKLLKLQRESILQQAEQRELEIARSQAEAASAAAIAAQRAALAEAAAARAANEALRQELELLQARATDRGMVMTLGDVLFAVGKADLQAGAGERLDRLVSFLLRYPERTILVEGHTDSQGGEEKNLLLSERRAEAVKVYLIVQSIDSARISAIGRGSAAPVADNATAEGRQQNRRVEIVISSVVPPAR